MNDWRFRIDRGSADKIDMQAGDCSIIETPGGGFCQPAVPKAAE